MTASLAGSVAITLSRHAQIRSRQRGASAGAVWIVVRYGRLVRGLGVRGAAALHMGRDEVKDAGGDGVAPDVLERAKGLVHVGGNGAPG